jgi:hypothetical protein
MRLCKVTQLKLTNKGTKNSSLWVSTMKILESRYVTYLYGSKTKIWSREEDPSIVLYLDGPAIAVYSIRKALYRALCWTPYRVLNCTCSCTHCLLFLGHISCGEPSYQRQGISYLPFLSATTFHYRIAGPGRSRSCKSLTLSDMPGEMTAIFFAGHRSTHLQLYFFTVSPKQRPASVSRELPNSFMTSKFLSPKVTDCLASSIVLFPALIIYFVFCLLIFIPILAASTSSAK